MTSINSEEIERRIAAIVAKVEVSQRAATFKPALVKAGALIVDEMGQAPRKAKGAFTAMASPAQKRAYWARVSKGEAQHRDGVGYVREGSAKKWVAEPVRSGRVVVGNNAPHGVYLWGEAQQSFLAASRWPKATDVLEKESNTIVGFFEDALEDAWRR